MAEPGGRAADVGHGGDGRCVSVRWSDPVFVVLACLHAGLWTVAWRTRGRAGAQAVLMGVLAAMVLAAPSLQGVLAQPAVWPWVASRNYLEDDPAGLWMSLVWSVPCVLLSMAVYGNLLRLLCDLAGRTAAALQRQRGRQGERMTETADGAPGGACLSPSPSSASSSSSSSFDLDKDKVA